MKVIVLVLTCVVSLSLLFGCEGKTSYKVLSFFFDGVPNPDEVKEAGARGERLARAAGRKMQYKAHGPFAAKLCDACHNKRDNTLLMPIESLCLNCHHLNINKKYIHGPVASGGCRVCHDPHGSGYPFLLTAEPREFCPRCHDKSLIFAKEVHEGTTEQCTTCHDAHSSDMPNLLR